MRKLKERYVNFLEKDRKDTIEKIIYFFLFLLSVVYGAIVTCRNFLYNKDLFKTYKCHGKLISIGNISWGGSGKTTLSFFLYQKLASGLKVAVLRRGYGSDEEKMFKEKNMKVFTSINRVGLTKKLSDKFDLFILDDGFQYRKLFRDVNILVMAARELKMKIRLLPAGPFREPLSALKRADILIINHKKEIKSIDGLTSRLQLRFKQLSIYTSEYKFKKITDTNNNQIDLEVIKEKKVAAVTGIGYPQGFFNKLEETGIKICKKITYPDHHNLTIGEFSSLQENLIKEGIRDVLITGKDKYHLPAIDSKINFYIFDIEMGISEEKKFLEDLRNRLK
ncbi:MAG: tetraacyldisaccharide 4'-kinase [Candidatus Omnitrophica bacterium]|jgi:tetraacyldisaccharide 4'-kinase|nr:tetraacyldisaccharide 4'-kinase [Candidatus Omnitrophota bacterium]